MAPREPQGLGTGDGGCYWIIVHRHTAVNTSQRIHKCACDFDALLFLCIFQRKILHVRFYFHYAEAHTHTNKQTNTSSGCIAVGQGEQRNAALLRQRLKRTQQVTALTRRRSTVLEEACPPRLCSRRALKTRIYSPPAHVTLCAHTCECSHLTTRITQSG